MPAAVHHDLDVLAGGVKHFQHVRVVHQVEKGFQIYSRGQGIDQPLGLFAGNLDQAEVGPIGRLTHEFGVDSHEGVGGEGAAQRSQRFGSGDQVHGQKEARYGVPVNGF